MAEEYINNCENYNVESCYGQSIPGILGEATEAESAAEGTALENEAGVAGDVYMKVLGPVSKSDYILENFNIYVSYEDARNKLTVAHANGGMDQTDLAVKIISKPLGEDSEYTNFYLSISGDTVQLARGTYVVRTCYFDKEVNKQYLTIKTHPAMGSAINDLYLSTAYPRNVLGGRQGTLTHKQLRTTFSKLANTNGGGDTPGSSEYAKKDASNIEDTEAWKDKLGYLTSGENTVKDNTLELTAETAGEATKIDQFGRTILSQEYTSIPAVFESADLSKFETMVIIVEITSIYPKTTIKYTIDNGFMYKEYITGSLSCSLDVNIPDNKIEINDITNDGISLDSTYIKGVEITVLGNTNSLANS